MTNNLKQELKRMKADRAGERFKHAHERARQHPITSGWGRVLCFGLVLVCMVIGVILVFIPGPAFVFFILAGALIATQWWKMACWLDRAELAMRRLWARLRKKRSAAPHSRNKSRSRHSQNAREHHRRALPVNSPMPF